MKAIVLVGGSGTRLWPLSRENSPKQFLTLGNKKSFFTQTIQRLLEIFSPSDIIIATGEKYYWQVVAETKAFGITNIISEPCAKNTAPAIALGVRYCIDVLGVDDNEAIFVFPSDHLIQETDSFIACIKHAKNPAQNGLIVVFGIKPSLPETGYGYIETENNVDANNCHNVKKFVEKPDLEKAQAYLDAGNFYWNSGMFAFNTQVFLTELKQHANEIFNLANSYESTLVNFSAMPSISIDYAIMEKVTNAKMVVLDAGWSDIGSWDALYDVMGKDADGNVTIGDVVAIDTKNSLLIGEGRLVSAVGIDNAVIVGGTDAVLIAKRGKTQGVRDVVTSLVTAKRIEAKESPKAKRPWGAYTVLEEGAGYKVKRIELHMGAKISLQLHKHRSEHWVVVIGKAKIRIGEKEIIAQANESVFVPQEVLHRLENVGDCPLQIIEVQSGEYLGEDDIIRFDDDYGRSNE
ncbi:MAG: mannose-1-phosphate guanylyltransferase/mannose-6-phosphate isomerase [Deltaproteobacteria bacterium]